MHLSPSVVKYTCVVHVARVCTSELREADRETEKLGREGLQHLPSPSSSSLPVSMLSASPPSLCLLLSYACCAAVTSYNSVFSALSQWAGSCCRAAEAESFRLIFPPPDDSIDSQPNTAAQSVPAVFGEGETSTIRHTHNTLPSPPPPCLLTTQLLPLSPSLPTNNNSAFTFFLSHGNNVASHTTSSSSITDHETQGCNVCLQEQKIRIQDEATATATQPLLSAASGPLPRMLFVSLASPACSISLQHRKGII